MKVPLSLSALALAALPLTAACSDSSARPLSREQLVAAGRHLAEDIAVCADCHTPRGADGRLLADRWLLGTVLPFAPTVDMPWNGVAPAIAGMPTMTEEQTATYLMTGERPSGAPTLPPMPAYRMAREDAEAIAAYLKSLGG